MDNPILQHQHPSSVGVSSLALAKNNAAATRSNLEQGLSLMAGMAPTAGEGGPHLEQSMSTTQTLQLLDNTVCGLPVKALAPSRTCKVLLPARTKESTNQFLKSKAVIKEQVNPDLCDWKPGWKPKPRELPLVKFNPTVHARVFEEFLLCPSSFERHGEEKFSTDAYRMGLGWRYKQETGPLRVDGQGSEPRTISRKCRCDLVEGDIDDLVDGEIDSCDKYYSLEDEGKRVDKEELKRRMFESVLEAVGSQDAYNSFSQQVAENTADFPSKLTNEAAAYVCDWCEWECSRSKFYRSEVKSDLERFGRALHFRDHRTKSFDRESHLNEAMKLASFAKDGWIASCEVINDDVKALSQKGDNDGVLVLLQEAAYADPAFVVPKSFDLGPALEQAQESKMKNTTPAVFLEKQVALAKEELEKAAAAHKEYIQFGTLAAVRDLKEEIAKKKTMLLNSCYMADEKFRCLTEMLECARNKEN